MGRFLYLMFIGTVAGATSAFLPRLMTTLASGTATAAVPAPDYLSNGFLTIAGGFSVLIGLITAILYHSDESEIDSRQVFFYSLGIPALISGTLSTVDGANSLKLQSLENKKTLEGALGAKGIDILGSGMILEREAAPNEFAWRLIAPAYAQAQAPREAAPASAPNATATWDEFLQKIPQSKSGGSFLDPSIRVAREQFLVVLGRSTDKTQAEKDLATARTRFPEAQLVLREGQFLILRGSQPADLNNATLDVLGLERAPALTGQKPALIRLPADFGR
jgi:hypothetical protein